MSIFSIAGLGIDEIARLREILAVLASYGFGELFRHLPIPGKFILPRVQKEKILYSYPARLRMVLEELGPTFIKLGQFAASRPDIVPHDYIIELSKLRDDVPPVKYAKIVNVFKEELGDNWKDKFLSFSDIPIAAASIAQVYQARLADGTKVAVKVQRPDIGSEIRSDMKIVMFVARFLERRYRWTRVFQPVKMVQEFSRNLNRELDFEREALLIEKFAYNHRDIKSVRIPEVIDELSTDRIIVMTYIEGTPLSKAQLKKVEGKKLASLGVRLLARQVLKDGLYHSDPHPGNLVYTDDRKLSYLDFGQVGRLSFKMRNQVTDLLAAVNSGEAELVYQELMSMGETEEEIDHDTIVREIMEILDKYLSVSLEKISVGKAVFEIFRLVRNYSLVIHPSYVMVGKAILTGEETARKFYPQMNILEEISPMLKDLVRDRYSLSNIGLNLRIISKDVIRLISDMPNQLRQIINKLKKGQLEIEFRHVGLEGLISALGGTANRLSFSMIIAALIVGSSLLIQTGRGPLLFGLPALGLIGYVLAVIMAAWLLWSIIRSGNF